MKAKIFRVLVCFALVCALLVGISPIKSQASVVAIAGVSYITISAAEFAASALVTLGVMVGADQLIFDGAVNDLVHYLSPNSAPIRILQAIREDGTKLFYATADLLESVRCWLFDSGTAVNQSDTYTAGSTVTLSDGNVLVVQQNCYRVMFSEISSITGDYYLNEWVFSEPGGNLTYYLNGSTELSQGVKAGQYRVYKSSRLLVSASVARSYPCIGQENVDYTESRTNRIIRCFESGMLGVRVADGLVAGSVPTAPITSGSRYDALSDWAERQLYVTMPGLLGEDETTEVYYPIPAGTLDEVKAMSQADALVSAGVGVLTNPGFKVETEEKYKVVALEKVGTFEGVRIESEAIADSGSIPVPPSETEYSLDLTQFFPFCLPFDIYEFFNLLAADPVAPVFEWVIPVPQADAVYPISIDLSAWDSVAKLFRTFELLAFIVGLAVLTRDKFLRG